MPKRRVLAFGEYGGVASAICNDLIAYLLFLRKCHVPCTCSVAAPPWAQVLGLCPGLPQVQARERGRVPCSHRIWSLAALHGIPGRRWYSGGEWVHPWGGLIFYLFLGETKKIFEGNKLSFLICHTPNHT
jgi:hypothetical protein